MAGYSGLDFGTVHDEINYWMNHTSSEFKGGWAGSGENGNDFAMPTGTPVYAITSGTVAGAGYYGGGGVVSVQQYPGRVWYYQHLDMNTVNQGQQVTAGQLIGYSGGQNSGGNHPSDPFFSSYQHIEVGIDAPWGGIWGGGPAVGPNIDPRPVLEQIFTGTATGNAVPTGRGAGQGGLPLFVQASSTGPGGFTGLSATQDLSNIQSQQTNCQPPTASPIFDPGNYAVQLAGYIRCLQPGGIAGDIGGQIGVGFKAALDATGLGAIGTFLAAMLGNWQTDLARVLKFIFGTIIITASILMLILPDAIATLVSAAGFPEAAGAVRSGVAHPTTIRPHRIVANVYRQRAQEKQSAIRGVRYARVAQQEEVRREQAQQSKVQRGKATPTVLPDDKDVLINGPATPDTSQEKVKPEDLWKPSLRKIGFHAGTTSEKNIFDQLANAGFPKRAAPITQPLASEPPMRGKPTGLTHPPTRLHWERRGRLGIPILVRTGKQQPGPIEPPPSLASTPEMQAKRSATMADIQNLMREDRLVGLRKRSDTINAQYRKAVPGSPEALRLRKQLLDLEREIQGLENG